MADIVVQFRGTIYENGYGQIAQKVMRDRNIHAVAKAIYAYLVSFAGKDGSAFPSVQLMMDELGIKSKDTFYKYRNQLIDAGYITVETQQRIDGQFYNNVYVIEITPSPQSQGILPCPKKSTTGKSTTKKSTTKNLDTINNSSIQISDINNNQNNNNKTVAVVQKKIEDYLGTTIPTLLPLLPEWIDEFGEDELVNTARYIGAKREKWDNIVGTYRTAVTSGWTIQEAIEAKRDERYAAFYELFPNP